jgi:predicted nuclease with TOPRIM domain
MYDKTSKLNNSLERQLINFSEENKEMKSKVDESEGVMRRHMDKIKELCVILDKLSDENSNLRNENENLSKGFRVYVESRVNQLDNKLENYLLKMDEATENVTKLITKERDSELDYMIKNLTLVIKQTSIDKNDNSWIQNITSQLTEIISKTDRKNFSLGLSNRLLKQELEILRNSSSLFNAKL